MHVRSDFGPRSAPWNGSAHRFAALPLCFVLIATLALPALAQRKARSGKEVVDAVCASCHAKGTNGAPRIGDQKAWAKRAEQGLTALSDHALKGIRNMPAHGGNPGLSDLEIERAITYMVNQSGGKWVEPMGGATPALVRTSEQIVQTQCSKCHQAGLNGAPKVGDRAAWIPRLQKGLDALVNSAIHGHGPMPARGGLADLSDVEIRGAIIQMFGGAGAAQQATPSSPAGPSDPYHKVVGSTELYLGVVPAAAVTAQKPQANIPSGKGYYYVNVSLYDTKTKLPVTEAQVKVRVADPMTGETKNMELNSVNNTISYGNYFRMVSANPYTITVQIQRPGTSDIESKFEYRTR